MSEELRKGIDARWKPCPCGGVLEKVMISDPESPTELAYRMRCDRCDRIEPVENIGENKP